MNVGREKLHQTGKFGTWLIQAFLSPDFNANDERSDSQVVSIEHSLAVFPSLCLCTVYLMGLDCDCQALQHCNSISLNPLGETSSSPLANLESP